MLSACRPYGELELAEEVVKECINLEPWNSGNYILLSNIFVDEGRWDEVEKIRVLMREKSVKKTMGQSTTGNKQKCINKYVALGHSVFCFYCVISENTSDLTMYQNFHCLSSQRKLQFIYVFHPAFQGVVI